MEIAASVWLMYLGDDGLTNAQARGLAAALLETAEEWAARRPPPTPPPMAPPPEAAALNVACPICGVQPGEPCQDIVGGFIQSVE